MPYYNITSPVPRRILELLSDGLPHHRDELRLCLNDELAGIHSVHSHISYLRKVLRTIGEDIICEVVKRRYCYRHVILLNGIHSVTPPGYKLSVPTLSKYAEK